MKLNSNKLLYWTPRGLSLFIVFFWLIVLLVHDFGPFIIAAIMIWFLLFLVTLLAWKNAPLGGASYILLGILYLIFISGSFSFTSFLAASPFCMIGILFITDYFSKKRKNKEDFQSEDAS